MDEPFAQKELPPLPEIGWKFYADSYTAPDIVIWSITIISQKIREKRPPGMRDAHRIRYRYKERLWSMFVPEEVFQSWDAKHYYDSDKEWECGRSQICIYPEEVRHKFEEVRVSHLAHLKAKIDVCSSFLDSYAKEMLKMNESIRKYAEVMEKLGVLNFPAELG